MSSKTAKKSAGEQPPEVDKRVRATGPVSKEIILQARRNLKTELFDSRYCDEPSQGGRRSRRRARNESFDVRYLSEYRVDDLFDYDHAGWAPIHYACFYGNCEVVETILNEVPLLANLQTVDLMQTTPLLLAVMGNSVPMIELLLKYEADPLFNDWFYHGVVELAAFKQYTSVLRYLIKVEIPDLFVWKRLVAMAANPLVPDALNGCKSLTLMLKKPSPNETNANWQAVFENGFVETIVNVVGSGIADEVKVESLKALDTILAQQEIKEAVITAGFLPVIIAQLANSRLPEILRRMADVAVSLCASSHEYAVMAIELGLLTAFNKAMSNTTDVASHTATANAIGKLVDNNLEFQDALRETKGCIEKMVKLFDGCTNRTLILALSDAVPRAVRGNPKNQMSFVEAGITPYLNAVMTVPMKSLNLSAIEAFHSLAEYNPDTQRKLLAAGVPNSLLGLMRRTRYTSIQERTAGALWGLAGNDVDERTMMAERIGMQILNEFLESRSPLLNLISAEAMQALTDGPRGEHDKVLEGASLPRIIKLIQRRQLVPVTTIAGRPIRSEAIVLAAIRAIGSCCVRIGFVGHGRCQMLVCEEVYGCLPALVRILTDTKRSTLVRAEAGQTLGCIVLGNKATLKLVTRTSKFSFETLVNLFHDEENPNIKLVVGSGLAAFAYNSVENQRKIVQVGRVLRFQEFFDLMNTKDQMATVRAAFQAVVLCRCFLDKRATEAACVGIRKISDILHVTKLQAVRLCIANFIASLSHTKPGLPEAFVSLDVVHPLAALLTSESEHERGCAAITLGYLAKIPLAKRQILNACRVEPVAYKVLVYYTAFNDLPLELIHDWQHFVEIGLPPIESKRLGLVRRAAVQTFGEMRPMTMSGTHDTGLHPEPGELTGEEVVFPQAVADNTSFHLPKLTP